MAQVKAICTNCNKEIEIDNNKDAGVCPHCLNAFVSEKAIKLYNARGENSEIEKAAKRRFRWNTVGRVILLILQCIGSIISTIFLISLISDLVDGSKKK